MSFEVNNFLSDRQAKTFHALQASIQQKMEHHLYSEQDDRIQIVRNILDVIFACRNEKSAVHYNRYFTLLLSSDEKSNLTMTAELVEISRKGMIDQFFSSAWKENRCLSRLILEETTFNFMKRLKAPETAGSPIPVFNEKNPKEFFKELHEWQQSQGSTLPFHKIENYKAIEGALKIALSKVILASSGIQESDLDQILNLSGSISKKYGAEMVMNVVQGMLPGPLHGTDLMVIFASLNSVDNQDIFEIVNKFSLHEISLAQFKEILSGKMDLPPFNNSEDKGIDYLISRLENDPTVKMRLSDDLLQKIKKQYQSIENYCHEWKGCTIFQLVDMAKEIAKGGDPQAVEKLVAIVRLSLFRFQKKYLYSTQIFALLGLLAGNKSTIAQVKTGEGKSLICVSLAFVLAMQKRAVHVISSSSSLSKRDAIKFKPFFFQFDLIANHICHKKNKAEDFKAHILYGTPSDFEFALMRELLYFAEFFIHFDAVIVDEADNLTIDTQLNAARLAIPAPFSFEWVYGPLYKALVKDSNLSVEDLRGLLMALEGGKYANHVAAFEDQRILTWKDSALKAKSSKENRDYVIRFVEKEPEIVIVDKENTGQLNWGCRWQNGIHEFLEAKHNIPVQKESLNPISMSHVVFYRKYKSLYGLTGTLGSEQEREQIAATYNVLLFDVPPFRPCIRKDLPPEIFIDRSDYYKAIKTSIKEMVAKGRPVLVICESIEDSILFSEQFRQEKIAHQLYNELQEENEEVLIEKAGDPWQVTLTTNNAGRGTDILLKAQSKQNGGLHVILTFYPKSLRVEEQAISRGGRQGEPGSSQMIILREHLHLLDLILLGLSRKAYEIEMAAYCKERAEIEIYTQPKIEQFYDQLAAFKNQILSLDFTRAYAGEIANCFLYSLPSLPLPQNQEDRFIKDQVTNLLLNRELSEEREADNRTRWEALLSRIGKRIIEICILEWTLSFFQKLEEINITKSHLDEKKSQINALFAKVSPKWERYLNTPRDGFIAYVKEISGANLKNLIK